MTDKTSFQPRQCARAYARGLGGLD